MTIQKYETKLKTLSITTLEDMYNVMQESEQRRAIKRVVEEKKQGIKRKGFGTHRDLAKEAGDKGKATRYGKTKNNIPTQTSS